MVYFRKKRSVEEVFWSHATPKNDEDCWEWEGTKTVKGYGQMTVVTPSYKVLRAHRVSWELHNRPIPPGLHVLHKCDNRSCVNPSHLFVGKNQDNVNDAIKKGRFFHGVKLTEGEVMDIRKELENYHYGLYVKLAKQYGVSQLAIRQIAKGDSFSWLRGNEG